MKNFVPHLRQLILVFIAVFGITSVKAQNKEVQAVKLRKTQVSVVGESVKVSLRTDTVQHYTDKGIKFSIVIKNIGNDSVKIYNLLDLLSFSLIDESGKDVAIPHISKNLAHTRSYEYKAFKVEQVKINGKGESKKMEKERFIPLKSKDTFEIVIWINQILGPDRAKSYTENAFEPLHKGKYTLYIDLALKEAKKANQPIGESQDAELLTVSPVTINYDK